MEIYIFMKWEKEKSYFLPVSQLVPSYPGGHVHLYPLTRSVQVAPFRHGSLAHSWISKMTWEKKILIKCARLLANQDK